MQGFSYDSFQWSLNGNCVVRWTFVVFEYVADVAVLSFASRMLQAVCCVATGGKNWLECRHCRYFCLHLLKFMWYIYEQCEEQSLISWEICTNSNELGWWGWNPPTSSPYPPKIASSNPKVIHVQKSKRAIGHAFSEGEVTYSPTLANHGPLWSHACWTNSNDTEFSIDV